MEWERNRLCLKQAWTSTQVLQNISALWIHDYEHLLICWRHKSKCMITESWLLWRASKNILKSHHSNLKFPRYILVILYSQIKYTTKLSGGIQTRKHLCTSVPLASCSGEIKKIVLIGLQCSWALSSLHTCTPSCFRQIQIMQSFQLSSSPTAQKSNGLIYIWHCRVANSAQKDRCENATKKD